MKVIVKVVPSDQNIMEFDGDTSGLSQEEIAKNIYQVAKEWIERFENDSRNLNSPKTK